MKVRKVAGRCGGAGELVPRVFDELLRRAVSDIPHAFEAKQAF
jgi:hypothetical protein